MAYLMALGAHAHGPDVQVVVGRHAAPEGMGAITGQGGDVAVDGLAQHGDHGTDPGGRGFIEVLGVQPVARRAAGATYSGCNQPRSRSS